MGEQRILDHLTSACELGAGERTLLAAQQLVEEGRLSRPHLGASRITAHVGDPRRGRLRARLQLVDGRLRGDCSCGRAAARPCAHVAALAMLVTGEARAGAEPDEATSLEAREVRRRQERGRSGLFTVRAESSASSAFGEYRVSSPSDRTYRVIIRAVDERHNSCTCGDRQTNRIGTCKHIEAVLVWLGRGRRRSWLRQARESGPLRSYLYIDDQRVRLRTRRRPTRAQRQLAARWLDDDGVLVQPLASAWPDLRAEAEAAEVELPAEVVAHAQRAVEDAARATRWRHIEAEVRGAGRQQPGFSGRLYPYQVEGVAFLASRGRALLADDMGLGKTAQTIAAMARLFRKGQVARVLVVCPASLKHQWAQEISRFTRGPRALRVQVVGGGRKQRLLCYRSDADVFVVNYEQVRSDEKAITALGADLLVLDEAQRIKNWRTKTADAVKRIDARHAFVLTGTPLENRLDDLYSLMQVVDPHILGPLWAFNRDFVTTDARGKPVGYHNLAALRERLRPHLLRRRKEEVLDQLPERITTRLVVPLSEPQRDTHDDAQQTAARLLARLKKRPLTPAEEKRLLSAFQRMRMACNAAQLIGMPEPRGGSPKLAELARLLEEICVEGGHKVVVFSEWEKMQKLAADIAEKLGLGAVRLHGGVPSSRRGALIQRFNEDPGCQVFLSTDAGGVGLNLQAASHVINLDLPWNPAVLAQRIARAHRLGQKSTVNVVLLVGADSIEERIEHTLDGKRALFGAAVGDDTATDHLQRTPLAGRIATLLSSSFAAQTGKAEVEAPRASPDEQDGRVAALRAAHGDGLQRVVETGSKRLIAVVADDAAVASSPANATEATVITAATASALAALGDDSPLAAARELFRAGAQEQDDPAAGPRRVLLDAAGRKLEAARTLEAAGHGAEALAILRDAISLACRAAADRDPGDEPSALLALVYARLIPEGVLGAADAHALARAGELARAFAAAVEQPPSTLVTGLIHDATDLLARLRERLQTRRLARAA